MLILTIRTDNPQAELGLYNDGAELAYETWTAHRQLAETIHKKINNLLQSKHKRLRDIEAIVCFKGPGSFTGLRIGISVANGLAYGLNIPVLAEKGENWVASGLKRLRNNANDIPVAPLYGHPAKTTIARK